MVNVILQKFVGESCSGKNYDSEEVIGSYPSISVARDEIERQLGLAKQSGYEIIDNAYFDRKGNKAYALHMNATHRGYFKEDNANVRRG